MFAKLLKYDLRSVFKYWWIGAVSSVAIAVLGGFCIRLADVDYTAYSLLPGLGAVGIGLSVMGLFCLPLLTEILSLVRFYKHFFTDEGYLTFTLPVKRTTLLSSKLVMTALFSLADIFLLIADAFLMISVGLPEEIFDLSFWNSLGQIWNNFLAETNYFGIWYVIWAFLMVWMATVVTMLSIYFCMTFANMITRRVKILVAIAFYYGLSTAMGILFEILLLGGGITLIDKITSLGNQTPGAVALLLAGVLAVFVAFGAAFYLLTLYILDKRLNLD